MVLRGKEEDLRMLSKVEMFAMAQRTQISPSRGNIAITIDILLRRSASSAER